MRCSHKKLDSNRPRELWCIDFLHLNHYPKMMKQFPSFIKDKNLTGFAGNSFHFSSEAFLFFHELQPFSHLIFQKAACVFSDGVKSLWRLDLLG